MEFKKAEQVSILLKELKEIDEKVMSLEKMANKANEENIDLNITLSCGKKQVVITSNTYTFNIMPWREVTEGDEWKQKKEEQPTSLSLSQDLDQKNFFIFCNYMLEKYNKRREILTNKISELIK